MRARYFVSLATVVALGGCAAGSGGSGAPVAPIAAPFVPSTATFPLSFVIPNKTVQSTSAARAPRYASQGTASIAIYDGPTVIYVANYNQLANPQFTTVFAKTGTTSIVSGTCVAGSSSQTCTVTILTTIGTHSFDVIMYPVAQGSQRERRRTSGPSRPSRASSYPKAS